MSLNFSPREYASIGIPARFATPCEVDLSKDERYEIQSVREVIELFKTQQPPQRGIILLGSRGTGKTTWLTEIAKAAYALQHDSRVNKKESEVVFDEVTQKDKRVPASKIYSAQFKTFWDFIADLRKSFKDGTRYAEDFTANDFIFLDDLGKVETQRDWFIEAFQEVVDNLYNAEPGKKALFITSNLTSIQIAQTFGDACKDRLDAMCYTLELKGRSLRQ